ncbi:hypothetical protein [Idiomarina sp. HP20-50]|uniref:hypothetical protein n=1 Tax=Idiomarina sp. HP20-50 TaxID=3070813 RepID=UPI00294AE598|nr:hypothetical protein [Idiomarina sp. HP20-50]
MSESTDLLTSLFRILAPILFIAFIVLINRKIGLKYPLGALSCIGIFVVAYFGIDLFDKYVLGTIDETGPLDSIFDVAVPILLGFITVVVDYTTLLVLRNIRTQRD